MKIIENPDLVSIALNSGVDFIVITFNMSYDHIIDELEKINKIDKISRFFNRIIVAYYIDYKNMDIDDFDINAIDNYVNANLLLSKFSSEMLNANGIMINDLYKAMFGKRGPYTPYEWMLGIGETIYRFKEMNKVIPVTISFSVPQTVNYGVEFLTKIDLINTSSKPIGNLKIDFLPVLGETIQKSTTINLLPAGKEMNLDIPIQIETNSTQFVRKKSFVGIRLSWPENQNDASSGHGGYVLFRSLNLNQISQDTNNMTNVSRLTNTLKNMRLTNAVKNSVETNK